MSTWIPPEKRTIDWEMSGVKYRCKMRMIDTYTEEEIRRFGVPGTGDKELDNSINNSLEIRLLSILEMVEYYNRGVNLYFCDRSDIPKIYNTANAFLTNWASRIKADFLYTTYPADELMIIEEFAVNLYNNIDTLGLGLNLKTPFNKNMQKYGLTLDDIRRHTTSAQKTQTKEVISDLPERDSLAPFFMTDYNAEQSKWNSLSPHFKER